MSDGTPFHVESRAHLWAELFALAEREKQGGDGRALRILARYHERLEEPKARPLHEDNGA